MSFELSIEFDLKCVVIDPRNVVGLNRRKYQRKKLKKSGKNECELIQSIPCEFNAEFFANSVQNQGLQTQTRLVLGLHPDQATEPLVDCCLKFGIPFAVIPCCVFSHENPNRLLKNGQEPNTYETFCDFLMEKSDGILCENLNFKGRNKVLYKLW